MYAAIPRFRGDAGRLAAPVTLKSLRLYDETGASVAAAAEKGSVSRSTARLILSREQTVQSGSPSAWRLSWKGTLSPAGGNFTLQYDPSCLQLTAVLKLHPSVRSFDME